MLKLYYSELVGTKLIDLSFLNAANQSFSIEIIDPQRHKTTDGRQKMKP